MPDNDETNEQKAVFDFSAYPPDTFFHDRREGKDRRAKAASPTPSAAERRAKPERRKRIDPTTFEKQYTADELEFMNAMQQFKMRTGKPFPSYGEVLAVARQLGYAQADDESTIAAPAFEVVST